MEIIKIIGRKYPTEKSKQLKTFVICKCKKCGIEKETEYSNAKRNKSGMCKRCELISRNTTHNLTNHRIYSIYRNMKDRCCNKNNHRHKDYGERGITVCDEWKNNFMSFYNWAIENGYSEELSIDRINNDKGYSPDNCRWVDILTQANNKRELSLKNTSGALNVHFCKTNKRWVFKMNSYRHKHSSKYFNSFEEAKKYQIEYFKKIGKQPYLTILNAS